LDQLGDALRRAEAGELIDHEQMGKSAGRHGEDLLRMGLTIGQVVHAYGDVCQTITELSVEQGATISGDEFKTLNLCLDDAIAWAVTEYSRHRELTTELATANQETERLGLLAHELRNLVGAAMLAFQNIKSGRVAVGGPTGLVLGRTLVGLRDLIDRSLTVVRLDAGLDRVARISVAELIEEVELVALLQAEVNGLHFSANAVEHTVTIEGDRQVIAAALSNLVQNAFKFTRKQGHVSLTTFATSDRVLFAVEDECGGLPPGKTDDLFRPFEQRGSDRSGVGLGLYICRKAAAANGGEIRVRNLPGKGCVFALDLPRKAPPPPSVVEGGKGKPPAGLASGGASADGAPPRSSARATP
jgi:signal transduction histidine kinase